MLRKETKERLNRVFDKASGREVASLVSLDYKVNYLLDEVEMKQLIQKKAIKCL